MRARFAGQLSKGIGERRFQAGVRPAPARLRRQALTALSGETIER